MFARFFSAPVYENGAWSTFSNGHLLDTDRIVSYEYTKRWCRPGDHQPDRHQRDGLA